MITGHPLGTVDGFAAAVQATHDANAVVEGDHAATAQAAVDDLPANRVPANLDRAGGDDDGDGPGR